MPAQAIQANHAEPIVGAIQHGLPLPVHEPPPEDQKLRQSVRVVEGEQVLFWGGGVRNIVAGVQDFPQPGFRFAEGRRVKPGAGQHYAQRVDVAARRPPVHQIGLQRGGSPSQKRIRHQVARPGVFFDEKFGQLRLEAGPVAYLVQAVPPSLPGRPKLFSYPGRRISFGRAVPVRGRCIHRRGEIQCSLGGRWGGHYKRLFISARRSCMGAAPIHFFTSTPWLTKAILGW